MTDDLYPRTRAEAEKRRRVDAPGVGSRIASVRLTPPTKDALERAALQENRTVSSMIERIIIDWLEAEHRKKGGSS